MVRLDRGQQICKAFRTNALHMNLQLCPSDRLNASARRHKLGLRAASSHAWIREEAVSG